MRNKVIFSLQGWIVILGNFKSLFWRNDPDDGYEVHIHVDNFDRKVLEVLIGSGYLRMVGTERIIPFPANPMWQSTCTAIAYHQNTITVMSLSQHFADVEVAGSEVYIHAYGTGIRVVDMKVGNDA